MSNLLASLLSSADSLRAFERALDVTQNNVGNVSTPGFARQRLAFAAKAFDPDGGLQGGVDPGQLQSARDEHAEQSVRRQFAALGHFEQRANSLAGVEGSFDISGQTGIPAAINKLLQSFSAWSVAPNSPAEREAVIENARKLSQSFQQTATNLAKASGDADTQLRQTVKQINALIGKLQKYNVERRQGGGQDAGLDAQIHTTLEQLSELVDFSALPQADGSVTVLLGGQTPLLLGDRQFALDVGFSSPAIPPPANASGPVSAQILDEQGIEITSQVSEGKLKGLLEVRNSLLPSLRGDANQAGDLNRLAKTIADRVNSILQSGSIAGGAVPDGIALFTYNSSDATAAAASLTLNPAITPAQLAANDPGPPPVSNGSALKLAALASPQNSAGKIDNFSYTEFFGNLAGRVGGQLSDARDSQDVQKQLLAQARTLRGESSGVSLDEEAAMLIQFQRSYQATARMISVLNDLTETTVNLLR